MIIAKENCVKAKLAQALIADCGGQLSLGEEEEGAVVRIALRRFS